MLRKIDFHIDFLFIGLMYNNGYFDISICRDSQARTILLVYV